MTTNETGHADEAHATFNLLLGRHQPDGTVEWCPHVFKRDELQSWVEVLLLFGGGSYVVKAQCTKTYRIFRSETEHFAWPPPRPFGSGPQDWSIDFGTLALVLLDSRAQSARPAPTLPGARDIALVRGTPAAEGEITPTRAAHADDTQGTFNLLLGRQLPNGTVEWCPRVFKRDELQSWVEVLALYGGGTYVVKAQCAKTLRFLRSETEHFSWPPPRPFGPGPQWSSTDAVQVNRRLLGVLTRAPSARCAPTRREGIPAPACLPGAPAILPEPVVPNDREGARPTRVAVPSSQQPTAVNPAQRTPLQTIADREPPAAAPRTAIVTSVAATTTGPSESSARSCVLAKSSLARGNRSMMINWKLQRVAALLLPDFEHADRRAAVSVSELDGDGAVVVAAPAASTTARARAPPSSSLSVPHV